MKKFVLAVALLLVIACLAFAFLFPESWKGLLGDVRGSSPEEIKERVVEAVSAKERAHSKAVGASLGVPKGWKSEIRSVGTPALIVASEDGDSVSVTFQRVPAKTRLEEFAREKLKAGLKEKPTETESNEGRLGDIAGWKLVATHGEKGARRTSLIYVLPRGERYYTVHCSAKADRFEKQRGRLEDIAASLKIDEALEKRNPGL